MTTIAYCHKNKEIAVDSRITSDNQIITDKGDKFRREGGQLFVGSSVGDDWLKLIDIYLGKSEPIKRYYECTVMFTCDGVVFLMTYRDGQLNQWSIREDTGIGSGGDYALCAMDFGMTAKASVKYAMTRDCKSGGRIRTFKV